MRNTKRKNREHRILEAIILHVKDNIKIYFIASAIFVIGIIFGVQFINNMNDLQETEITQYINNFVNNIKENNNIDKQVLLRKSIINNVILVLFMWFVGSTVVGIPLVFAMVGFRGFCLGYTVSALIAILGQQKGIAFFSSSILLQNLIVIPCILALAVSGIKLYKSILKDKRKENIKLEIVRHTLFSTIMLTCLIVSSFVETFISTNIVQIFNKYF